MVPFVQVLAVEGPVWIAGRVKSVSHRDDGRDETVIVLDTDGGERRPVASGDGADYALIVDAATDACLTGARISFLVSREEDGGKVDRFRLESDPNIR
jgi:hypothetical protein